MFLSSNWEISNGIREVYVDAVFLDLKKAFNTVNNEVLLSKPSFSIFFIFLEMQLNGWDHIFMIETKVYLLRVQV